MDRDNGTHRYTEKHFKTWSYGILRLVTSLLCDPLHPLPETRLLLLSQANSSHKRSSPTCVCNVLVYSYLFFFLFFFLSLMSPLNWVAVSSNRVSSFGNGANNNNSKKKTSSLAPERNWWIHLALSSRSNYSQAFLLSFRSCSSWP